MWRSNALPHEQEIQDWDKESYETWLQECGPLSKSQSSCLRKGITKVPMRLLWTGPHDVIPHGPESLWYAPHVQNFRTTSPPELPQGFIHGATHDGIAINTTIYLTSLASTVHALGGQITRVELPTNSGLSGAISHAKSTLRVMGATTSIDLVVNATGLEAYRLVPDASVYPIRGQTVTVKGEAEHITTMFYPEANASITPRIGSGVSVLGSSYEKGNWERTPDDAVTMKILERCKPLAPELLNADGEFAVVSVNVAFRPGRRCGPRLEMEEVVTDAGETVVVCHEYGHAGGGYQNSFGSARKVVALVDKWFRKEQISRARL
ncbi:hypothetical protein EDD37DRAFT_634630 [Exophiala viscosa]|uniref:uncharacterized protein n=1 Tax=Exophiala viscosa TaxID=2486360 RepID=UPI00218DE91F|nr:hypothetical protein EDD37DRAFT_634630 [Exophiala viscosa]